MRFDGILLPEWDRLRETVRKILTGRAGIAVNLSILGLLAGFTGVWAIFLLGHGATTNTSDLVPWGIQISTYVYFVLISTGCTFVNFFGEIFYEEEYKPYASRIMFLAIVTAFAAFIALATEMGHIERMYYFFVSPNPTSPMFWMSVWYAIDVVILLLEYANIRRQRHSRRVMWAAFFIAVVAYGTLGSLFGAVSSRVYYYSPLLPVYFLFMAFLSGSALASVVAGMARRRDPENFPAIPPPFPAFLKVGLGLAFFASFWRLVIGLSGYVVGSEVFHLTLFQNVFYGIFLGIVAPFFMLHFANWPGRLCCFIGVWVLVTQFLMRVDLVVGGFRVPVFRAYDIPELVRYTPSVFEVLVVVASVSLVSFLYLLCDRSGLFGTAAEQEA